MNNNNTATQFLCTEHMYITHKLLTFVTTCTFDLHNLLCDDGTTTMKNKMKIRSLQDNKTPPMKHTSWLWYIWFKYFQNSTMIVFWCGNVFDKYFRETNKLWLRIIVIMTNVWWPSKPNAAACIWKWMILNRATSGAEHKTVLATHSSDLTTGARQCRHARSI